MIGQVRSEIRKITTTNTWWIMLIGVVVFTALAWVSNHYMTESTLQLAASPEEIEDIGIGGLLADDPKLAAVVNLYTSGQYFGSLLVLVLGGLLMTNEFRHQTVTATFLASNSRLKVVGAKLLTAVLVGAAFGLVSTTLAVGLSQISIAHYGELDPMLTDPKVLAGLGLNLLAFGVWAVLGLGLGTLLRNQVAAIVVGVVLKFVGQFADQLLIGLGIAFDIDWVTKLRYVLPDVLSQTMTTLSKAPDAPHWYTAAAIMIGYGLLAAGIGGLITRRRDVT
jgi:ABC-2 type transport system permease protein